MADDLREDLSSEIEEVVDRGDLPVGQGIRGEGSEQEGPRIEVGQEAQEGERGEKGLEW